MKPQNCRVTFTSLARVCLSASCAAFCASQSASALDGTWTNDGSSAWSTPGNWSGGTVADGSGFTANFNTIDITTDRIVSLDGDRMLTNLTFGDTEIATTPAGWVLDNNGTSTNNLILAGTNPTITVNALGTGNTTTISAIIEGGAAAGTAGLVKAGTGTLVLSSANTFTGNVNHFTGGAIVVRNSGAFGSGAKVVGMNSVNVTLRLDGSAGDLSLPADTSFLTAGLQAGGSIINVAGNTTINGPITLNSGASGTAFSVDSGTLTLANTVRITGSTVRTLYLRGASNGTISGVILNGGASLPVNKDSGSGTWTLSGANTYTGNTTVSAGTLKAGIASTTGPDSGPFGVNSTVTVNASGTLDLAGFNTRINALIGTGSVTLGAGNLTIGTANATSTFDGTISGTGGTITKTGTGAQRLGGTNSYDGGTTVTNGDLIITHAAALGGGPLILANTASQIDCFGLEGGVDLAKAITIDLATHRAGITAFTSGNNTLSGPITINNSGPNNTVAISNNVASGTMTISNTITSSTPTVSLSFRGSGAGSSGLVSNTISLPATAFVDVNGTTNWTFSGSGSTWGGTVLYGSANIILGASNALSTTAVTGDGTGTGAIDLAGYNQTVGGLAGPAARVIANSSTTGDSILTINAASPQTFAGVIADVLGSGSRKVSVALNGGVQTLSGANTYTGATTLNGGTLLVTGSLGSTAVEVKNSATLAGTGSLGGNVAVGSGGHQAFDVAATAGTQVARAISGSLTLNSGNIIDLTAASPPAIGGPYVLATATGGITVTGSPTVNLTGLSGTVAKNGNNLELTVTTLSGFSFWITGTFANGPVPDGQQGPNADPDNDGLSNLVEYAIAGADPTVPNSSPGSFSATTLSFSKRQPLASDIAYAIEESTDLGSGDPWSPVSPAVNDDTTISYTLPGGPAKDFLRLKVLKP